MRIPDEPRLPTDVPALVRQLTDLHRQVSTQLNLLSEGFIQAATNADTAAPTTGDHYAGDQVRNSAPSELGAVSSKYVILGWVCVASGTPGTWLECRVLTGN